MPVIAALLTFLILGLPVWWFRKKFAESAALKPFFWPALIMKIACGLLIGLFYNGIDDTFEFQYTANRLTTFALRDLPGYLNLIFSNDLSRVSEADREFFKLGTNSFFVCKIISVLNFITGNNYYLNGLFFSVYSFFGCWSFVRTCSLIFHNSRIAGIFSFLFFPSVVFWSSGIMKESILLGSLGFFWAAVLQLQYIPETKKSKHLLLLVLSGWLLWKIRFFLAAVVFALTGSWLVLNGLYLRFGIFRKFKFSLLLFPVIIGCSLLFIIQVSGAFDLNYVFNHIVWDYNDLLKLSLNKPHIEYANLQPNFLSILKNVPKAIFSSFFRPLFGESFRPLYVFAGLENTLLLVLTAGSVYSFFKKPFEKIPQFYLLLIVYILIIAVILTLPTPNLGTLNRYRVAFVPFAVFLMLQTAFWQKCINKLLRGNK